MARRNAPAIAVAFGLLLSFPDQARASPGGHALDPGAATHQKAGLEHYSHGAYEDAIREFQLGYALDPHPDFLFAWAQAERLTGDCAAAIELYKRFIDSSPPERQVTAARSNLEACEEEVAATEPEPEPEPQPERELEPQPQPQPAPPPQSDGERRWWQDVTGGVLVGGGLAVVGVGAGLMAAAAAEENDAENAATYEAFDESKDRARSRRIGGAFAIGGGAALFAGGVVRYLLVGRKNREAVAASAWIDRRGGAGFAVSGRF